jgi:hypothetical protein
MKIKLEKNNNKIKITNLNEAISTLRESAVPHTIMLNLDGSVAMKWAVKFEKEDIAKYLAKSGKCSE